MAKPERQPKSYLEVARDNTLAKIAKLKPDPGGRMAKSVVKKLYPDHKAFSGLEDPEEAPGEVKDTPELIEVEKTKSNGSTRTLTDHMKSYYQSLMDYCNSQKIDPNEYHFLRNYRSQTIEHTNGTVTTNGRLNGVNK